MSNFTNYLTSQSTLAEEQVFTLVKEGKCGEEVLQPSLNWEQIEAQLPGRVTLIREKGGDLLSGSEGWDQLGIDIFFEWEGVKVALDITSGSSTVIKNKKKKLNHIKSILPNYRLGVLTIRRAISAEEWEDFLLTLQDSKEVIDHRWV